MAHGRRYRRSADLKLHQYSNPWNRHPRIWYDWSCSALGGRTYWLVRASISKVILDTFPHRSTGWLPIRNCNGNGVSLWRCGLRSLSEVCLDASMAMLLGGVFEHPENLEHESQRKTHCAAELRRILESRDCYGSSEVLYRKSLVNRICIWREEILTSKGSSLRWKESRTRQILAVCTGHSTMHPVLESLLISCAKRRDL